MRDIRSMIAGKSLSEVVTIIEADRREAKLEVLRELNRELETEAAGYRAGAEQWLSKGRIGMRDHLLAEANGFLMSSILVEKRIAELEAGKDGSSNDG